MRKVKFQTSEYYHVFNRGVDKRNIFMDEKDYLRFLESLKEFNRIESIGSLYKLNYQRKKEAKQTEEAKLPKGFEGAKQTEEAKLPIGHKEGMEIEEANLPIGHKEGMEIEEAKLPIGSLASSSSSSSSSSQLVKFICYNLMPNHYHIILEQLTKDGISKFMQKLNTGYTKYFNFKYERSGSLFESTYKSVHIKSNEYLLYLSAYVNGNAIIHKVTKIEDWPWSSYKNYLNLRNGCLCNKKIILDQFKNINDYRQYVNIVIKEASQRKDEIKKYLLEKV